MARSGAVTFKGNPMTLAGDAVKVGQQAPDFKLHFFEGGLKTITPADLKGKPTIISVVPSLDTGVCQKQTKKFNDEVKNLSNVEVLVVSMDLPFGQKRWCGAEGVTNVKTLSAHRCTDFGSDYGVLISGGGLDRCLSRPAFKAARGSK